MGLDYDDKNEVMRHFQRESSAYQSELVDSFGSFLSWMSAIATLLKLIEYAVKIWKWIKSKW